MRFFVRRLRVLGYGGSEAKHFEHMWFPSYAFLFSSPDMVLDIFESYIGSALVKWKG